MEFRCISGSNRDNIKASLCDSTTQAAIHFAARHAAGGALPAPAAALAREVLRTMLLSEIKLTAVSFLLLVSVATGADLVARSLAIQEEPARNPAAPVARVAQRDADRPRPTAKPDDPAAARMAVAGRVLDPDGKPVPNAAVMVYAQPKLLHQGNDFPLVAGPLVLGQDRSDGSGRFQIDALRTGSSRYRLLGVSALAPGYGIGWVALDPDADQPGADVSLRPEQVIHGRLLDLQGRPAQGVELRVGAIERSVDGETESLGFRRHRANVPDAWPAPVFTGDDGRFSLHGLSRATRATLIVDSPRFALQGIIVETEGAVGGGRLAPGVTVLKAGGTSDSNPLTMILQPARLLTGRVTDADTGKPIGDARIGIGMSFANDVAAPRTGADGRFRARVAIGDRFDIRIVSPQGQPYRLFTKLLEWPKGAVEQSIEVALTRGVMIHGKVTEAGSGEPVAEAMVRFIPRGIQTINGPDSVPSSTSADGSFQLVTEPGPGYLVVRGPSEDYVLQAIGRRMLQGGQPGGARVYAHAFAAFDSKPAGASQEIVLRRGVTVQGRAVGVDGQPVQDAWMLSRIIKSEGGLLGGWGGGAHGSVHDGRFALNGLDPDAEVPVYFLDPKGKRGATLNVSGKSAKDGPVTVRLEPCGAAKARLVDSAGKPVTQYRLGPLFITMVVTPGPTRRATQQNTEQLFADEGPLSRIDPVNYGKPIVSDAQGRVTLPVLIPGATYRLIDRTTAQDPAGPQVRKEFTVNPGETLELGDLLIERPK